MQIDNYEDIINLLHKCFEKENGFFQNLVPVLYKEGKNAYNNHIIVKDENNIIATIAVKKDSISIDDKLYDFLILGSLGVDQNYRNQGIMGALFEFILNKFTQEVDFFVLSGIFERYKRSFELLFREPSPIPIKYLMSKLGFSTLSYRLPLYYPNEDLINLINENYIGDQQWNY